MPDLNQSLPLPKDDDDKPVDKADSSNDSALNVIRQKLNRLYNDEPPAELEEEEIEQGGVHSKHQAYMKQLTESGLSLAEIQQSWHEYYIGLDNAGKHEVWDEFYKNQSNSNTISQDIQKKAQEQFTFHPKKNYEPVKNKNQKVITPLPNKEKQQQEPNKLVQNQYEFSQQDHSEIEKRKQPTIGEIDQPRRTSGQAATEAKQEVLNKVSARGKLKPKHHIQSLLFGVSMGLIVIFIFMFSFFNERFIAPFITPSLNASNSPIIIDPNAEVGTESLVIIPKINVEVPVVYNTPSIAEDDIQASLENGVVHYPTTPKPGENGNVVVVGHSSNNLLNSGKYKFAFVLLNRLEVGDTITMQYNKTRYVYKVYEKIIVKPTEVGVLGPTEKQASLSLITCDPPGTSINRLVVRAEQISPSTDANVASTASDPQASSVPQVVPGNAPSLFDRLFGWL